MSADPLDDVANRVKGQFPLSIATSLALESAVGIHPNIPLPPNSDFPIRKFKNLWINLRTLFRNVFNALPKGLAEKVTVEEMVNAITEEMEVIPDMLKYYMGNQAPKVTYYLSEYKDLKKTYPKAQIRTVTLDSTANQIHYSQLQDAVMTALRRHHSNSFMDFDLKLRGNHNGDTAIITHYAYDLFSYRSFSNLTLLESHTGKFKPSTQWYTKYHSGAGLAMIPFREDMMQVFGDAETFKPMSNSLRKAIVKLATDEKWSNITSTFKIEMGIEKLQDPDHKELMKSILV